MVLDFNLDNFIEEMRACKPPYRCPFDECGKIYKTFDGIHRHILHCNQDSKTSHSEDEKTIDIPQPFFHSPQRDSLTYTDAQKLVEFEADGRTQKFSIYDALILMSKDDYEASIPQEMKEKVENKDEDEINKTPMCIKSVSKKRKGPKFSTPKNPTLKSLERAMEKRENAENNTDKAENKDIQPIDKKVLKLPEAVYREIDDYKLPPAPPMPDTYYQFVEKSAEQLDMDVEYDMDEEDVAWLKLMNGRRLNDQLAKITEDQFELLMDRLEKESYFHVQTNGSSQYTAPVDDDAICCVCMDGEATNTNVILFCDLCNLAVHQDCYGVPYIPEGQWLCRRCLQSPSRSVECCLCPNRGGAFKQTDDGRWAHVVCGLWIPEVRFANTVFLEPIDSIGHIPPARWKLTCRVCRQRGVGACIQCHKNSCFIAFHVTCGLLAGLHMKMETVREAGPGGTSITVRKTACCDQHTPADSDAKPRLDDVAALGITTPKSKSRSPKKAIMEQHPLPILFRGLMNFSPQCPWDKVQKIAALVEIQKKNHFIQRLMAYWTLKRQTRNGVPLIRRLQFAKASKSDITKLETPQKNAHHNMKSPKPVYPTDSEDDKSDEESKPVEGDKSKPATVVDKTLVEFKKMSDERRRMRRLRHDLERVRLLCELIRKREQRKREIIVTQAEIKQIELNPFMFFLRKVLDLLADNDAQDIFADPVDTDEVADYLDIVKTPMDLSTMRKKLENFEYSNMDDFEKEFSLMVANCLSYNEKDTIFYRAGTKMRDIGGSIIRQAKRQAEMLGFDQETGLQLEEKAGKKEELSDEKLMREIDEFLNDENRENLDNDEHLKQLLMCGDKANLIHHPSAKNKRQGRIKVEIQKLRRKVSIEKVARKDKVEELEESDEAKKKVSKKKSADGKKRKRDESDDDEELKEEIKKKRKLDSEDSDEKGKKKVEKSPQKTGVNRRNAVLFTRKKAAQSEEKPALKKEDGDKGEEVRSSSLRRRKSQDEGSQQENEFEFHEPVSPKSPRSKKKGNRKSKKGESGDLKPAVPSQFKERITGGPKIVDESLFQTYRQGGALDTDTDTGTESANELLSTSSDDDSSSDSGDESYAGMSALDIPLEPLDLVWAKCRGYPWYPALIINPKMPRTGYFHNGVPIPVPPVEVLNLAESHTRPHYLILFFDNKRTWQWLPRDKLEPLGVDTELDKSKLVQSKKPGERKAVKKAYEEAILHRCRVTGETVDLAQACCPAGGPGDQKEGVEGNEKEKGEQEKAGEATVNEKSDNNIETKEKEPISKQTGSEKKEVKDSTEIKESKDTTEKKSKEEKKPDESSGSSNSKDKKEEKKK